MPKVLLSTLMQTHTLHDAVTTQFITPQHTGLTDHLAAIPLTGMALYTLRDQLRVFSPIVHDVIETADRRKMVYQKKYVLDADAFTLRKDYEISGGTDIRLNRGRMDKLVISTAAFDELLGITILPFETLPFVNKNTLDTKNLVLTDYTLVTDEQVQLKSEIEERITGTDMVIDRGRLAAFSLGLSKMEVIDSLEVQNA